MKRACSVFGNVAFPAVAAMFAMATLGADITWTGAGDGLRWNDAGNWDGAVPGAGDVALIVSGDSPLVVSNDVAGLSIAKLNISGDSEVTIVGEAITLTYNSGAFLSSVSSVVDVPLILSTSGAKLQPGATAKFNGKITLPASGSAYIYGSSGAVYFNAPIEGPATTLYFDQQSNDVYFYAPIDVNVVKRTTYKSRAYYFSASGNKIANGIDLWYSRVYLAVPNAFDPSTPLTFPNNEYKENSDTASTYLFKDGHEQTANYIQSGKPCYRADDTRWCNADHIKAEAAMTLTLKASKSASTYARLEGALTLIYDPLGDYVQTFLDRKHLTTGDLVVRGGTLRMDGTNYFASVPAVKVEDGAKFDVATTNSGALAAVETLALGDGARFSVAPTAADLFGTKATYASVRSSSRFVLADGATLRVGALVVDGAPVAAGEYSQTGDGTRLALAQVEGAGTLVVDALPDGTYWTGANGSDWNDSGNWTAGLPAVDNPAHIENTGTVSIRVSSADVTSAGAIFIENVDGETALDVDSDMSLSGGELRVGKGATMTVGAGATVVWDGTDVASGDSAEAVSVRDGGVLAVEGGALHFTNTTGRVALGGGASDSTGKLLITSGECDIYRKSGNGMAYLKGGLLKMTGGKFTFNHVPVQNGGAIDCSGDAVMEADFVTHGSFFRTVSMRLAGNSKIFWVKKPNFGVWCRFYFTPNYSIETNLVEVVDSANFDFQGDQIYFGTAAGTSILRADTSGKINFGNAGGFGVNAASGEFILSNGVAKVNKYSFYLGAASQSNLANVDPSGTMRMYGGTFTIGSREIDNRVEGITIGDGQVSGANYTRCHPKGLLELHGGTMSVGTWLVAGIGGGSGTIRQSGGALNMTTSKRTMVIGLKGGSGRYEMTGGSFSNKSGVYVGGCPTNVMGVMVTGIRDALPGYGEMSISGGTFSTTKDIYVGLDGHGAFNVGTGGVVNAVNMHVTNSYDTVLGETVAGALSFKFGPGSVGGIELSGGLEVAPGATLSVDLSAYAARKSAQLVKCTSMTGSFAPENITIIADHPSLYKVVQDGNGVRLVGSFGTTVFLK